jgi:hypothetical protein
MSAKTIAVVLMVLGMMLVGAGLLGLLGIR